MFYVKTKLCASNFKPPDLEPPTQVEKSTKTAHTVGDYFGK